MRKLVIMAIVAGVALGGAAACASNTPADTVSSAPGSTTAAATDETADVCAQALALEKADGTAVLTKVQSYLAAIAQGQAVDSTQVLADLTKIQSDWVTAFTAFAGKQVKPEVETALQNFITFVQGISQNSNLTVPQVTAQYESLDQALATACGAGASASPSASPSAS
jgi:hypothetical protein